MLRKRPFELQIVMLLEEHISDMEEFQFPIINEKIIPPTRSSMDRTSTSSVTPHRACGSLPQLAGPL